MTLQDGYAIGFAYGIIDKVMDGMKVSAAQITENVSANPLKAFRLLHERAMQLHVLSDSMQEEIGEALDNVDTNSDFDIRESPDRDKIYFEWSRGYHRAYSGKPFARHVADEIISIRNTLGLSQTKFAKALGTTQELVSRWEAGKVVPSKDSVVKIRQLKKDDERD